MLTKDLGFAKKAKEAYQRGFIRENTGYVFPDVYL